MNKVRIPTETKNIRIRNRNHRTEEYNNQNEKFNKGVQQETTSSERKDQPTWTQGNGIHCIRGAKIKEWEKVTIRDLWDTIRQTNICILEVPEL